MFIRVSLLQLHLFLAIDYNHYLKAFPIMFYLVICWYYKNFTLWLDELNSDWVPFGNIGNNSRAKGKSFPIMFYLVICWYYKNFTLWLDELNSDWVPFGNIGNNSRTKGKSDKVKAKECCSKRTRALRKSREKTPKKHKGCKQKSSNGKRKRQVRTVLLQCLFSQNSERPKANLSL